MAFHWHADDGQTLNAGLVALWFLRGSGPVLLRNPIFLWFSREGGLDPYPPPSLWIRAWSKSRDEYFSNISLVIVRERQHGVSIIKKRSTISNHGNTVIFFYTISIQEQILMRGSRIFFRGGGVQARRSENSLNNVFFFSFFSLVLNLILQFTEGVQWFYYRENYTFPRIQRGAGATFSKGGGGGPNTNFYRNPYNLWFSRGSRPPIPPPPLDPHMTLINMLSKR